MTTERTKEYLRRKSTDSLFRPILSKNDLNNQHKPPSPFQTGLRYLKFLGQIKRQNVTSSPYLTSYYTPLPPLSSYSMNKSIQVDDFDDLSYKTAINKTKKSYLSLTEFIFCLITFFIFILILFFIQLNSYPLHCLLHKKYWYPINLSNGFQCQNTNIEIHYLEIFSKIYQIELEKNSESMNCLGFNILSCLPIDDSSISKQQIIRRNNQFINYCNSTKQIHCSNQSLTILPLETKWNLRNYFNYDLKHCSCSKNLYQTKCFHFMIKNQCDLQIPWFDYCLKYSQIHSTCQAYIIN